MISVVLLTRNEPHLDVLLSILEKNIPCDYELCVGYNGNDPEREKWLREKADVFVSISDKELFRMGIPWCHNKVIAQANTYKIFYIDADEYPVWVHPDIESIFDTIYIPLTIRFDFFEMGEILTIDKEIENNGEVPPHLQFMKPDAPQLRQPIPQDRLHNSRYAKFEGLCHSTFRVPQHFRGRSPAVILLHNNTVRIAKNKERMDELIREQFARQLINPALATNEVVLGWGRKELAGRNPLHKFKDYKEFVDYYKDNP